MMPFKRELTGKHELLAVNLTYLLTAVLFLTVGSWAQYREFHTGIIITEYGLLVIPVLIWGFYNKINWRAHFRLNLPKPKDLLLLLGVGLLMVPFVGFLNSIISVWLVNYFNFQPPEIPTLAAWYGPFITFFIAAITPGLCEEFFFRGMVLRSYEKRFGLFTGALMSAVLFGFFHFNPMNLLGPIFLGLMFSWVLQVTGSIATAMFSHMVNNGVAVIMLYVFAPLVNQQNAAANEKVMEQFGSATPLLMISSIIFLGAIGISTLVLGLYLLRVLRKRYPKPADVIQIGTQQFIVTAVDEKMVFVLNQTAEQEWLTLSAEGVQAQVVKTSAEKIFSNRNSKYLNKHWDYRQRLTLKPIEWIPLILTLMLYIGFTVLIFITFMSTGA